MTQSARNDIPRPRTRDRARADRPRTILITGAAGNLGRKLGDYLTAKGGYVLRRIDLDPRGDAAIAQADLAVQDQAWMDLFDGVDAVVHLAANGSPEAEWADLTGPNVDGLLNVLLAAAAHGTPRVVIASSVWAVAARHQGRDPLTAGPPDPGGNSYGATKLLAERAGRAFALARGLTVVALRVGACRAGENEPVATANAWEDGCWLSNIDMCAGFERAILAPMTGFGVVNLTSANQGSRWSLAEAEALLDYRPTRAWSRTRQAWRQRLTLPARAARRIMDRLRQGV